MDKLEEIHLNQINGNYSDVYQLIMCYNSDKRVNFFIDYKLWLGENIDNDRVEFEYYFQVVRVFSNVMLENNPMDSVAMYSFRNRYLCHKELCGVQDASLLTDWIMTTTEKQFSSLILRVEQMLKL